MQFFSTFSQKSEQAFHLQTVLRGEVNSKNTSTKATSGLTKTVPKHHLLQNLHLRAKMHVLRNECARLLNGASLWERAIVVCREKNGGLESLTHKQPLNFDDSYQQMRFCMIESIPIYFSVWEPKKR